MKNNILIIAAFFFAIMLTTMLFTNEAEAKTKKWNKACAKYEKFITKNRSNFEIVEGDFETKNTENYKKCSSYLITDMDRNGVPELITKHDNAYMQSELYIFTCKKGRVIPVKTKSGSRARIDISSNAAGYYTVYKCKKGHLHTDWEDRMIGFTYTAYKLKKGRLVECLYYFKDDFYNEIIIRKNNKDTNFKAYTSATRKCKTNENSFLLDNR